MLLAWQGGLLGSHGSDPLSGVNVSVNNDSGLGTLATAAPNVDTSQGASLD
jgi:hypothetical protein